MAEELGLSNILSLLSFSFLSLSQEQLKEQKQLFPNINNTPFSLYFLVKLAQDD